MKRLMTLIFLLCVCLLFVVGASEPPTGVGGVKDAVSVGGGWTSVGTGSAEVVTTIYSGRAVLPNDFVDFTTFDVQNIMSDGSTIRYGYVDSTLQDNVYNSTYVMSAKGLGAEYYQTTLPRTIGFLWFSLNGLDHGDRVSECLLYINVAAFAWLPTLSVDYFSARVDTISADYGCLGASSDADSCLLDISWNNMDASAGSTPWVPDLSVRKSMYEFGPKSSTYLDRGAVNAAEGDSNVFNLTDAIQQIADRGQAYIDRGVLILVSGIGGLDIGSYSAGANATWVGGNGNGNPALTITKSNIRGQRVWNSTRVPVIVMVDDVHDSIPEFYTALSGTGVKFDMVVDGANWGTADEMPDSLYQLNYTDVNIIPHGTTHISAGLGSLTGKPLNDEIDREAWITSTNFTVMPDTSSGVMDFAWTGSEQEMFGLEALWKLVSYGYRSARGTNSKVFADCPVGDIMPASWDNYTNIYTIFSINLGGLLLTGGLPETSESVIKERLMLFVDQMYTSEGRAAVVLYGHNADDGLTTESLDALEAVISDSFFLERVEFGTLIRNLKSKGLVDVDAVVSATNTARALSYRDSIMNTRQWQTSARQDSAATAEGGTIDPLFDKMWIGPAVE